MYESINNNQNKINETLTSLLAIEKRSKLLIRKHYYKVATSYDSLMLDNILSNGKCHVVAIFKEYLIDDDNSEFLKRYYKKSESFPRIIKISKYYYETSVIFPNYTPISEAKYIYKNIMKKQKVIDQQQELEEKMEKMKIKLKNKSKNKEKEKIDNVINDTAYNEILNQSESLLRIVFGIKKKKSGLNIIKPLTDEEEENEIEKIEKIINEIIKYESIQQLEKNNLIKNKIKLELSTIKNKPKLSIQTNNIKTINTYKNKHSVLTSISIHSLSPNSTHLYQNTNNSPAITSRNLKNNFSLTNNNSTNVSSRQINHKTTFSMPKINIIGSYNSKEKRYKLLSFNSLDNKNNSNNKTENYRINKEVLKTFFISNATSSNSNNKKCHKKIRSVLGRNNTSDLYKTYNTNFNEKKLNKGKKIFHIKKLEELNNRIKPIFLLNEQFLGFYTERNKK